MATALLRNPHLLVLVLVILFVGGFNALRSLPRLEDPRLTNRNPVVLTFLPGASAEQVEAQITEPLERELREVAAPRLPDPLKPEIICKRTAAEVEKILRDRLSDVLDNDLRRNLRERHFLPTRRTWQLLSRSAFRFGLQPQSFADFISQRLNAR